MSTGQREKNSNFQCAIYFKTTMSSSGVEIYIKQD